MVLITHLSAIGQSHICNLWGLGSEQLLKKVGQSKGTENTEVFKTVHQYKKVLCQSAKPAIKIERHDGNALNSINKTRGQTS
jgi:hypothetical protein